MTALNHILFKTAEDMSEVKDGSAQLVILSPPYIGHHSQREKRNEKEFLFRLFSECARIVSPTGVVASVNHDFKDQGMIYLRHIVVVEAAQKAGLFPRDEKIWVQGFKRDQFRKKFGFVLIFSKNKKVFQKRLLEYEYDNWLLTKSQIIKNFRDAIPPEIPILLINNFTEPGDLVVSSCAGTGTIVIAALREKRKTIGYEINPEMKEIIIEREQNFDSYFSPK